MKIRKATSRDFKEIGKIFMNESSKKPYTHKWTSKKLAQEVKDFIKDELFVAVDDNCVGNGAGKGKVVGFIASNIEPDNPIKAYIKELWIDDGFQGQGIGKALVKYVELMYKKKGVKIIRLVTLRNAASYGFYENLNYNESKNQVFMERKLR
jgi:ribosomal protein S18 acetylase RimI-like enzyme